MKFLKGAAGVAAIAAAMASTSAGAVNISQNGIGEVAISPFYTTRNNWQTLINLTNTTDEQVVVKVRFHEAYNSRDVLDFIVALSAEDVFVGRLFQGNYNIYNADGSVASTQSRPVFQAADQANADDLITCTVPSLVGNNQERLPTGQVVDFADGFGTAMSPLGFDVADADATAADLDRLKEGYIEFIVMGTGDADIDWRDVVGDTADDIVSGDAINVAAAIEEHDCAALDLAFRDTNNPETDTPYVLETARQLGEPTNSIKFNTRLLNRTLGVEVGVPVTTWANFFNPNYASGDTGDVGVAAGTYGAAVSGTYVDGFVAAGDNIACGITRGDERVQSQGQALGVDWVPGVAAGAAIAGPPAIPASCQNLIAAQRNFAFLDPSLADAYPPIAVAWDDDTNIFTVLSGLGSTGNMFMGVNSDVTTALLSQDVHGIDAVSATVMRESIENEWSTNPGLGVSTEWAITFPTKGHYVDGGQAANSPQAARAGQTTVDGQIARRRQDVSPYIEYNALTGTGAPADFFGPFEEAWANGQSCDQYDFIIYDRAEQSADNDDVIISPAPLAGLPEFCYETNVITFNAQGRLAGAGDNPVNRQNVSTFTLVDATSGWMDLTFDTAARTPVLPTYFYQGGVQGNATRVDLVGKPVIGFMMKVRNINDGIGNNFASAVEHGYRVEYLDGLTVPAAATVGRATGSCDGTDPAAACASAAP